MKQPFFSIVICNYNLAAYVGAAVESALNQDYPPQLREVIVVDDGSTDDSRTRLVAFAERPDVAVLYQANGGQASALSSGVAVARGDYVCLLDSDDWFLPNKLARLADYLGKLEPADDILVMHDYAIYGEAVQSELVPSWFKTLKGATGKQAGLGNPSENVRISIPCGQVYSRPLIQRLCEGVPVADFRQGADVVLGHGGFIASRQIHYLRESLAVYRVHGANEMAGVDEEGQYFTKNAIAVLGRWPKQLQYFESLIASLASEPAVRQERLAYLSRLTSLMHSTSAGRGLQQPRISFVVLDNGCRQDTMLTVESLLAQGYENKQLILVRRAGGESLPLVVGRSLELAPDASKFALLSAGIKAAQGEFLNFVEAGDRLDPAFAERLIHVLQYGTPAMQVVCDIRLVDGKGCLLQAEVFRSGGEWHKTLDYLPPLKTPPNETLLPPLAATVLRSSELLVKLFMVEDMAVAEIPDAQADWLVQQFAHALGGTTRLAECYVSHVVTDGAQAAWSIRTSAHNPDGSAAWEPDWETVAQLFLRTYLRSRHEFRRIYPETWHAQFIAWLSHGQFADTPQIFHEIAADYADEETMELLQALDELGAAGT